MTFTPSPELDALIVKTRRAKTIYDELYASYLRDTQAGHATAFLAQDRLHKLHMVWLNGRDECRRLFHREAFDT